MIEAVCSAHFRTLWCWRSQYRGYLRPQACDSSETLSRASTSTHVTLHVPVVAAITVSCKPQGHATRGTARRVLLNRGTAPRLRISWQVCIAKAPYCVNRCNATVVTQAQSLVRHLQATTENQSLHACRHAFSNQITVPTRNRLSANRQHGALRLWDAVKAPVWTLSSM